MDPKQCFFGNDCCGIIVLQIQIGGWEGFIVTDVPRGTAVTECFWSLVLVASLGISTYKNLHKLPSHISLGISQLAGPGPTVTGDPKRVTSYKEPPFEFAQL